jgi:hypothetical protein
MYTVEVQLTNGKKYFLGEILALREEKTENIECEEEGDFNKDFVIRWNDLKDIDELSVMTSVLLKSKDTTVTQYDYKQEKIIKIGSKGSFTVSKSEYIEADSIINNLNFRFRTTKKGKVNPELEKGSWIKISTLIEKSAHFEQ